MNRLQVKDHLQKAINKVAPEVKFEDIVLEKPLRAQVEMDSYDIYNLIVELEKKTGISISERDLVKLKTLEDIILYMVERSSGASGRDRDSSQLT